MSDAAHRRGSGSSNADAPDLDQSFLPKGNGLFGGDRMDGVNSEREAASSQIQRSLKAWRKAKDDDQEPANFIPQPSSGRPLPGDVRKRMEPKLGADLSGVRLHEGEEAHEASSKLGARAFTVGSDVHFNKNEFQPGTKEGDRLIAHELTHVVQGQKSGVHRKAEEGEEAKGAAGEEKKEEKGDKEKVSDPNEPAEKEADAVADKVVEGEAAEGKEGKEEEGGEKKKDEKSEKDEKGGGKSGKDGKKDQLKKVLSGENEGKDPKAEAEGEKKEEKPEEKAPEIGAKLEDGAARKVFRVKSKEDKKKEVEERKKLLTAKVELAAKAGERVQKVGELVASIGIDALATLAGPAYPAIAPILKELVPSTVSVLADTKREIDVAVLSKAIGSMTNTQLKKLENSLKTKEPSLGDFKTAVGKRTFDLEAAAMAGGALNFAKEGLKNVGKEGAKKGLLEVLKHIAEKIVPLADAVIALTEIISLSNEMSKLRGEIEELEKAV